MVVEIVVLSWPGSLLLQRQMRDGVVATGTREAVIRRPRGAEPRGCARATGATLLSAVQRRELRLLARDRTVLVQTLLIPALIVGMQVLLQRRRGSSSVDAVEPLHLAAIAFALAA